MIDWYPAIKALHVLAAILLVGALLTIAVARPGAAGDPAARARLIVCSRLVATPALVAVWLLGLTMAFELGWFAAGWLKAKLVLVLALTALHGWQSRRLRAGSDRALWPVPAIVVLAAAIATLAAVKP